MKLFTARCGSKYASQHLGRQGAGSREKGGKELLPPCLRVGTHIKRLCLALKVLEAEPHGRHSQPEALNEVGRGRRLETRDENNR